MERLAPNAGGKDNGRGIRGRIMDKEESEVVRCQIETCMPRVHHVRLSVCAMAVLWQQ